MTDEDMMHLIEKEHFRRGVEPQFINNKPEEMPTEKMVEDEPAPTGMRFLINVNEAKAGESVTVHVVHGTWSRRENKRALRQYLSALGYTRHDEQKRILKGLGFWTKKQLGTQA